METYYDVLIHDKLIQTDLTKREVQDLFDIDDNKLDSMCYLGAEFMGQYSLVKSIPDEPIPNPLTIEKWFQSWLKTKLM